MNQNDVRTFWQHHPCGELFVGGLDSFRSDYEKFFEEYDQFRYGTEGHILKCLDNIDFADKQTLEIGLGQGADSEQIIRRNAKWSGIDLTAESINRVRVRLELKNLAFEKLVHGSVLDLPFEDNSFDVVYSHGVLHHVPDIQRAQEEIWRVLKPDGMLVAMLYAKYSLNFLVAISIVRRLGLLAAYNLPHSATSGMIGQHLANARKIGLFKYLKMDNFIHRSTDGPLNPYSKVYDIRSVKKDFRNFKVIKSHKEFMHAPPLPVRRLPLAAWLGWHLWVYMAPKTRPSQ